MIGDCAFTGTCIGELHSSILHRESVTLGRVLNAFDTTINIRTNEDELLVVTLGRLRSPVNLNVISNKDNLTFKRLIAPDADASVQIKTVDNRSIIALSIGNALITITEQDIFRNHVSQLRPDALEAFANNSESIFSALISQAQNNRFGCLLNPDATTRGLFAKFVDSLVQDVAMADTGELKDRTLRGLLEMCGKGPGFTPAGDDFIAGYMALCNWLNDPMKPGCMMLPDTEFSTRTTWTSFKLIEYAARNLLDEQAQKMIDCIANGDVVGYTLTIELISKRGHTSGIDFATGMTMALFANADRVFKTRVLKNLLQTLVS